jgi:protein SCO1/2
MNRAGLAAGGGIGRVGGAGAAPPVLARPSAPPALERATLYAEPRPIPAVALVDQAGAAFGPERLRGRWNFVFFGFVNCPDICPTTLATLAGVTRSLADLPEADRPGVVLVSVDPARDTPPVLARYVAHFDPGFVGVTGSQQALDALARALGVAVVVGPPDADGDYAVDHTAAVFLVGPGAQVAALFNTPHDADAIARDYRRIVAARRGAA